SISTSMPSKSPPTRTPVVMWFGGRDNSLMVLGYSCVSSSGWSPRCARPMSELDALRDQVDNSSMDEARDFDDLGFDDMRRFLRDCRGAARRSRPSTPEAVGGLASMERDLAGD